MSIYDCQVHESHSLTLHCLILSILSLVNSLKLISLICLRIYHKIHPEEGSIGFSRENDFKIVLNASHGYVLTINDPHFFSFPTTNPAAIPRTSLVINVKRNVGIYLKVTIQYKYNTTNPMKTSTSFILNFNIQIIQ